MESITKKILAGLLAAIMAMSFAACSENSDDDDDDDKPAKKVSSSVSEAEDEDPEEDETTTTTTTEAETEAPEETTTTTEAVEVPTGDDVYDDPDFAAVFDPAVWTYYDMSDVDTAELAQKNLGIDLNGAGAQVKCYYYNVNDPITSVNVVATSVPGITPDLSTSEFIDYFTEMFSAASDQMEVVDSKETKLGNNNAIYIKLKVDVGTGTPIVEEQYDVFGDGKMVAVTFTSSEADFDSHAAEFKAVIDSLVIK